MPVVSSGPFGHQSAEQYDMDLVVTQLQIYYPIPVQTQYCKNDHIWLSSPRNMRYNFYEYMMMIPYLPIHWVKVSNAL